MLVKKIEIGNTKIEIHDNCITKSEEEKKHILARIADITARAIRNAHREESA